MEKIANGSEWKLDIHFEHTSRAAPHHDHLVEIVFSGMINKEQALMILANVPKKMRHKLFPQAFTAATKLNNLISMTIDGKTKTRCEN